MVLSIFLAFLTGSFSIIGAFEIAISFSSGNFLTTVESLLQTPSDYVFNTVGVYGVAESAALYSAKKSTNSVPELILSKQKNTKATCAIARAYLSD